METNERIQMIENNLFQLERRFARGILSYEEFQDMKSDAKKRIRELRKSKK